MSPQLPDSGEVIHGKYLVHRLLGRGGVGVVFEAEHLRLRQPVALKMLAPEMLAHPDMVERFEREARAMASLQSPHVTRVIDVDISERGIPYLVMELLHGRDLQHELKERGALAMGEAVHWVREACVGMETVHAAGIVHRDLKPANLFLVDGPRGRTLKIMDFGISKVAGDDNEVTMTVATLGTPAYMSPEQVRSAKHIDVRADVWSLGVILYRALTGKLPFNGSGSTGMAVAIVNEEPTPIEVHRGDLPPALLAVVHRALAKHPDARFPNVTALAEALAPFDGVASAAPVTGPREQENVGPSLAAQSLLSSPDLAKKSRAPMILAAGLVLAAALAGVVLVTRTSEPPNNAPEPKPIAAPRSVEPETPKSVEPKTPKPVEPQTPPVVSASVSASVTPPKPVAPPPPPPVKPPPAKPSVTPMPVLL